MAVFLVRVLQVVVILLLLLLAYLWIPEESLRSRKKRRRALSMVNESMATNRVSPPPIPCSSQAESKGADALAKRSWKHERVERFYAAYISPHANVLNRSGYLRSIDSLLELLDRYGDCPSVVKHDADREYQQVKNVYDLLSRITLLEHSLNVACEMVRNFRANTRDLEMILGKILVTSLGHDIGKIRELIDSEKYAKGDHPYISYLVMKRVILGEDSPQKEEILTAIREHHFPVREGFTYELRKADQQAREMETEKLALRGEATSELICLVQEQKLSDISSTHTEPAPAKGSIPEQVDLSWLDLGEFLSSIERHINVSDDGIHFSAFSMKNGLVYVTLDLVSESVFELAKKHNHPEVLVGAESKEKKRAVEYTVKTMLVEKGVIPSFIGEGYSGARFAVYKGGKRTIGFYLPIQADAFTTPLSELEARKKNAPIIGEISDVKPLVRKKS